MTDILAQARAALDGVTEGPWERGDHYHVQGASHCECRPGNGRLVAEKQMDINGEMMLAHVHRSSEPWWPYGIYSPRDTGGVLVVQETHEHGMMTKADAEFIAWARTGVPELLAEVERLRSLLSESGEAYLSAEAEVGELRAQIAAVRELADAPVTVEVHAGGGNLVRTEEVVRPEDIRNATDGEATDG